MKRLILIVLALSLSCVAQMPMGGVTVSATGGGGGGLLDDFNRADNSTLGANWTAPTGQTQPSIASNIATSSGTGIAFYNARTWNNNQWDSITLTGWTAATNNTRVCVRMQAGSYSGYCVGLHQSDNGNITQIVRKDSGTTVVLASESTASPWAVGDVCKISVTGTAITLYRNGVLIASTTDATYASGSGGIVVGFGSGADNFSGGDN